MSEREEERKSLRRECRLLWAGHAAGLLLGILCALEITGARDDLPLLCVLCASVFTCFAASRWCWYALSRTLVLHEFREPGDFGWNSLLYGWRRVNPRQQRSLAVFLPLFAAAVWIAAACLAFLL